MKKNIFIIFKFLIASCLFISCEPQEINKYKLDSIDTVAGKELTFTITSTSKSDNEKVFENTSNINFPVTVMWDLGNGAKGAGNKVTAQYPEKGEYTVTLTVYASDGSSVSKSQVVIIAEDDFGLVNTTVYVNLTGGSENASGKAWMLDQHNNYAKEVATATGFNISGHMGLGPQGSRGQEWWGAAPNDKNMWEMYSSKFTFIQNGAKLQIKKDGNEGYGRNASSASKGGFSVHAVEGDDALFTYSGGDYTFSIDESGQYPILTISDNGFLGYYCGSQEYEIIYQTEEVMALRVDNTTETQDWVFVYCLEELNKEADLPPKTLKEKPLSEDFEGEVKINFIAEDMGETSRVVDNPAPLPINTSDKVYRYWKSNGYYSNLSYTASDYKFDLTEQNKIRVKVYIPSYNDYTTENNSEDWISEKRLRSQLALKLQNSEHGSPWETQTEIVKGDLETDKWLSLEFDFSGVSNRQDYDRIVIQFGGEGHGGSGFFFFDDFEFDK